MHTLKNVSLNVLQKGLKYKLLLKSIPTKELIVTNKHFHSQQKFNHNTNNKITIQ